MNVDPAQEPSPANLPQDGPADPVVDTSEMSSIDRAQAAISAIWNRTDQAEPPASAAGGESPGATAPGQPEEPAAPPPANPETPKMVKLKVDGREIDVPESELTNLAQMGFDYTRKNMALAEERKRMEAWNVLHERIQTDPQFAAHVFGYGQQPPQHVPKGDAPPADPIEQLISEAVARSTAAVEQKFAPVMQQIGQRQEMTAQELALARTIQAVQVDPLRAEVEAEMTRHAQSQLFPEEQQAMMHAFDNNPAVYTKYYRAFRQQVEARRAQQPPASPAAPQPGQPPNPLTRQAPPQLEGAGASQAAQSASVQANKERAALVRKINEKRGDLRDVGRFLELSGAFARLHGD